MTRLILSVLFIPVWFAGPALAEVTAVQAFPELRFTRPLDLQDPGDGRLFLIEQAGVIHVFPDNPGVTGTMTFLDIRDRVNDSGNEQGLLGLAFHPDYAEKGWFYVDYTAADPNRTVIARYSVDPVDPDRADPASETIILEVPQPYANHNGGRIVFGPDGYLYIGMGDGGSAGDPSGNGQNRETLLGAILRIDIDHPAAGLAYGIPPDNPFAATDDLSRDEIWVWGLRNPWRFSFDLPTGRLWAADVGQNAVEEVDLIEPGKNYGWNIMEGDQCYSPAQGCDPTGFEPPVFAYTHDTGQSITGGFVYRGTSAPELTGAYIFADYVSGFVWALTLTGPGGTAEVRQLLDTGLNISSFGTDASGELYFLAFDGRVYRFETVTGVGAAPRPASPGLEANIPNPFNPATTIPYRVVLPGPVAVEVYDLLGRHVVTLVDEWHAPGSYAVCWNGRDDAEIPAGAGVYIAQLRQGDQVETIRMSLVK